MFKPRLENLPAPQRTVWEELSEVPGHFVLYGGTALALRLGHLQSVDFGFFSSRTFNAEELLTTVGMLQLSRIIQNTGQTLTVAVDRGAPVKLSFFGGISIGRVGTPDETADGVLSVASLLDLAGTKAKVVLQRAESKDYLDLLAILNNGIDLPHAMAAARALYGEQYNPILTIKSLTYFADGDLFKLTSDQKDQLTRLASAQPFNLPDVTRVSDDLSAG